MSYFDSTDGVRLHYEDSGSGRAVVLISGYAEPGAVWRLQEKALIEAGYRVVTFDRRSHGKSENALQGQHLCRHAADVHELISHLGLEKPVLIGHSMGASAIYACLSVFGDGELAAAICIDQTPCMLNKPEWNYGMYGFTFNNMATFFDSPIPDGFYRDQAEGYLVPFMDAVNECDAFDLVRTKPLLLDHAYADWRDVFPTLQIPVLFIAGVNSPYWSCEHARACAEMCIKGSCVMIPECGHAVQMERPDECAAVILDYLRRENI